MGNLVRTGRWEKWDRGPGHDEIHIDEAARDTSVGHQLAKPEFKHTRTTHTRTHIHTRTHPKFRKPERKERGVLKMPGSCGPRLISGYEAEAHLVCYAGPPSDDSPVAQMDIGSGGRKRFCSSGCGVLFQGNMH